MAKYYVESGPGLKTIVQADNYIEAILKAFNSTGNEEPLELADVVIVSQSGFVRDRDEECLVADDIVIPTRLLLGEPEHAEHAVSAMLTPRAL